MSQDDLEGVLHAAEGERGEYRPRIGDCRSVGHVSDRMLKHYSHIRMKAKREAMEAVMRRRRESEDPN